MGGGFLLVFVLPDMKRKFLTPDLSDIIYKVELNSVSIRSFPMAGLAVHFLVILKKNLKRNLLSINPAFLMSS